MNKIQTLAEYSELASRTCADLGNPDMNLLHMNLGITTEIGELLDNIKKKIAYNKIIDIVNFGEELADICWYLINKHRMFSKLPIIEDTEIIQQTKREIENKIRFIGVKDTIENKTIMVLDTILLSTFILECKFIEDDIETISDIYAINYIADLYNIDFWQILTNNIEKLKIRFPDKFNEYDALNRNLDKEREQLEK